MSEVTLPDKTNRFKTNFRKQSEHAGISIFRYSYSGIAGLLFSVGIFDRKKAANYCNN